MAELVIRVVSDVLRHVAIKNLKGRRILGISSVKDWRGFSSRSLNAFSKGYSPEFPVLFPQITLEDLSGGEKAQDGSVAIAEPSITFFGRCSWRGADDRGTGRQYHCTESESS